jgi:hypothetical protein
VRSNLLIVPARLFIAMLFLSLLSTPGKTAEPPSPTPPEVRMSVNRTVMMPTDTLSITIIIKGFDLPGVVAPKWPSIPGFIHVDETSSVLPSAIGGRTYTLCKYVCSYIPTESGIFSIPSIQIQMPGLQFRSKVIQIKVLNPDGTSNDRIFTAPPPPPPVRPATGEPRIGPAEEMRIVAEASNLNPFLGDQVVITYKLLTTLGIGRKVTQTKRPDYQHFWAEQITMQGDSTSETLVIRGVRFYQILLDRVVVFPLETGSLTIEPATWTVVAKYEKPSYHEEERTLTTEPLKLTVQPLPAPPDSNSGRMEVGDYVINLNYPSSKVMLGQAFPIYLTIKGSGNIRGLLPPNLPSEDSLFNIVSIRAVHANFSPFVDTSLQPPEVRFGGEKVWEILVYPKTPGAIEFPSIPFTYFDTATRHYTRLTTDPIRFQVARLADKTVSLEGSSSSHPNNPTPWGLLGILFSLILILLGMVGYLLLARRRGLMGKAFKRRAPSVEVLLREAEEMVTHRGAGSFYDLISHAMTIALQQTLTIAPSALTRDELQDVLRRNGLPDRAVHEIFAVRDGCDEARFAGVAFEIEDRQMMLQTISDLHQELKERRFASKE